MMKNDGSQHEAEGVYIALLRGINVGGKNLLAMKDLVAVFNDSCCRDVRSYIQSGNVVFRADTEIASRIPTLITEAISGSFGLLVPVVIRTAAELEGVVLNNPFIQHEGDAKTLHIAFLRDPPSEPRITLLNSHHSPGDEFVVKGREIYLRCPNGLGRSKLTTQYFDTTLKTTSTLRNWNTVLKLLGLAQTR